jgi:glutamine---fructose-6-phosphate transaminase (isomerizing)
MQCRVIRCRLTNRALARSVLPKRFLTISTSALTRSIDELTRPVDAIKHQAKTVTVGISRSDEGLLDRSLVQEVLKAGVSRDRLSYKTLKVIADLDPAVASVVGFTRYGIEGNVEANTATVNVIDRGGISLELASRVDGNSALVGTKHRVATDRNVLVARGRRDNRTVIFVPEAKGNGNNWNHTASRVVPRLLAFGNHEECVARIRRQVQPTC